MAILNNVHLMKALKFGVAIFALQFFSLVGQAYDGAVPTMAAKDAPKEFEGIGINEKLGQKLDLSLKFKDDNGRDVVLSSFFDGKHPVIISPVYFSCPGLCNFHLNGLTDALKLMPSDWSIGGKYKILSVSFDFKETSDLAAKKKETYMKVYDRSGAASGWHFLTSDQTTISALTSSLGFKFRWDEAAKEWAHASAAIVVTPDGTISRYLPGIMFDPKDIKLALNEATLGKIGSVVDNLVLYCFKYDPRQSKYTLAAFNVMKLGGAVMVLGMVMWLLPIYIRSRRVKIKEAGR
jgi:protein SCO1/2